MVTDAQIMALYLSHGTDPFNPIAFARAILAAQQPAGWKLVPIEPTDEMLIDGAHHIIDGPAGTYADEAWRVYRAMLAAVPPGDSK